MFGIFRGHQPAPVPDRPICLPAKPETVTPKRLRELAKRAWVDAVAKAEVYHREELGPKLEKLAQEGKTETYVTSSAFGAPIGPLAAYLRSLGYVVSEPYAGGGQANVSWVGK